MTIEKCRMNAVFRLIANTIEYIRHMFNECCWGEKAQNRQRSNPRSCGRAGIRVFDAERTAPENTVTSVERDGLRKSLVLLVAASWYGSHLTTVHEAYRDSKSVAGDALPIQRARQFCTLSIDLQLPAMNVTDCDWRACPSSIYLILWKIFTF